MDSAILNTVFGELPAVLRKSAADDLKRFMTRQETVQLLRRFFRDGDSSCLDFGLSEMVTVGNLVALMKQTSICTNLESGLRVICTSIYSPPQGKGDKSSRIGHIYNYRIVVENLSDKAYQLLGRTWRFSSPGFEDFVLPKWQPGVIGEQPVISIGESFAYMSSCVVHNKNGGEMEGGFQLLACEQGRKVEISVAPCRLLPRTILTD